MRRNGIGDVVLGLGVMLAFSACGGSDGESSDPPRSRETVAEQHHPLIESVEAPSGSGDVSTFAGKGPPNLPGAADNADAHLGTFNDPAGIAVAGVSPNKIVYVADSGNNSIRAINPDGSLSTVIAGRPNLLVNPRAEDASAATGINGWTTSGIGTSGAWQLLSRGSQCNNAVCGNPYDGTYWFWGGLAPDARAFQDVDVSANAYVAAGTQKYHFSALLRGSTTGQARVRIEYLDSAKQLVLVGGPDSGFVNPSSWTPFTDERLAPTNTKFIRVILSTHATDGGAAFAYFDALELRAMRPSNAPASDTDKGLFAPVALGALSNGTLITGGSGGMWEINLTTQTVITRTPRNGYVPPRRVSSLSVVAGDYTYFADPTDPLLHVQNAAGFRYRADVETSAGLEPLALAARKFDNNNDLVWLSYRGFQTIYLYKCPRPSIGAGDSTFIASCVYQNQLLGWSSGFVDDFDGTIGSERFKPAIYGLATGGFNDLLITDEYNRAVRRNSGPYTRTLAGATLGYLDGAASFAKFVSPTGIAIAPNGMDVLVADRGNNVIRKISCGATSICSSNGACPSFPVTDNIECTTDTCEVLGVRHTPKATGSSCADGNLCNGGETCDVNGVCQPGTPPTIDDNLTCSADSCDPAVGPVHTALAAGTPCATGAPCSPLSACTGASLTCPAGPALPTDDANDCTVDACGATGVTHTAKAVGTACKVGSLSIANDGTCDSIGGCVPSTNVVNPGTLDRTLPTPPNSLFDDYLGSSGGQTGSTACVYDAAHTSCAFVPMHMALVRGTVADANGTGLAGATISVVNHPEYGSTTSLANGEYFLVVNGGAPLSVRATKLGFLSSDRLVNPPWGGTEFASEIALLALDSKVTTVTFAAGGLATGTTTTANYGGDTSPARTAAVYFPANVGATSGGVPLPATAKFRVTEYTAGAKGKSRMPADVAANTMYTYAAEFTLEDASGNRYDNVTFATPVMSYVDNFLGMTVGETVPVGYYDRQAANWQPMQSGRVIAVSAGGAVTGLQAGDPPISASELAALSAYTNKTLWRLPLAHFSPLDFNLGVGAPACETQGANTVCPGPVAAQATGGNDEPGCGSCQKTGSIIDVERQVLRETFPVVGTPFSLNYSSENTLGYGWNKTLAINFENHPKHSKMTGYAIAFQVAGKRVAYGGLGKDSNGNWPKSYQATWDGRDQDGRPVQGAVTATLDVGAVYKAERRGVTTFGSGGGIAQELPPTLSGLRLDPDVTVWTRHTRKLQVWDASALGFGGWTINVHHTFDPVGNVIYLGDGTHRQVDNLRPLSLVGGTVGVGGTSPDGTLAASAVFNDIESLAVGRDGEVFVAIPGDHVVRKISVINGQYNTVRDYAGKSGVAASTPPSASVSSVGPNLSEPVSIALHDDGRLVVADRSLGRVYEVSADGTTLRPIAGTGAPCVSSTPFVLFADGVAAKTFNLCHVVAVATGPDGSVYFINENWTGGRSFVARIDPAGSLWHIAGDPNANPPTFYSTLPAGTTGPQIGMIQAGLAVDRNNTVFLSTDYEIVAIPPGGTIRVYSPPISARTWTSSANLVDFALFGDGAFLRPTNTRTLQRCTMDGACGIVAGSTTWLGSDTAVNAPAIGNQMMIGDKHAIAVAPDGAILAAHGSLSGSGSRIFRIAAPLITPGTATACVYKVPSVDGSEYYCFDANGQHQSTVNAFTNGTIRRFTYYPTGSSAGLLWKIIDVEGSADVRETVIDRSASGVVKITSPNLQQTQITLDSGKKIFATTIAGAGSISPTHDLNNGLLTALTDADGQPHSFTYDNFGRLQRDTDPSGGYQNLTRTDTATGKYTVTDTTRLGKTDWFSREILGDGTEQRVFGLLNGLTSTANRDLGGTNTMTLADGTVIVQVPGADPRWGLLAPFMAKSSVSFPAGSLTQTTSTTRTQLSGVLTDLITLTGATTRTYKRVYTDSTKALELSTPLGRKVTYTLDTQGRVTSIQLPGVVKTDFTINGTTGLLDQVNQGTGRVIKLTHSTTGANKGFLTVLEDAHVSNDPAPLTTTLAPDGNGRALSSKRKNTTTLQDIVTGFDWTNSGKLKLVTPPGKPSHQLQFDPRGILKTYIPPTLGGTDEKTIFSVDLDRYLQGVDSPGWDDLLVKTDPLKGRVSSLQVGGQSIDYAYYGPGGDASCTTGCAGHLKTITDNRTGSAITSTFKWLNALPSSIDETLPGGAGVSTVSWTYDNDIRVFDETVTAPSHSSKVTLGYDADGLMTCASLGTCAIGQTGKSSIERDPASGRITGVTLDTSPKETLSYNAYGELLTQDSAPFRIDYEDVAAPRDAAGRVKRHIERIGVGAPLRTFNYTYDDQNRLWKVDGAVTSEYRYDDNGNRIYAKNSAGTLDGAAGNIVYDAQDRLTKYGATTFDYTLKGDVWHRYAAEGTTTYDYDALGALRSVKLPDARVITYISDGLGRRIGKQVNGVLVRQWVYGMGRGPLAELDGSGVIKMRFVYGSRSNVPDFVKTYPDGKLYRVYSNQLGTPRVLYEVAASAVAKTTEFDEFGIKLSDTNVAFEIPFGFAGGLFDPDTKLTRFGARDYDASIGRWVSKDPILFGGGQANLYVYVGNDPVNFRDPSGLMIRGNPNGGVDWLRTQADGWFEIAGSNWMNCDYLAAVGPAAMGAFVDLVPAALQIISEGFAASVVGGGRVPFNPNQRALVELAKDAQRTGVTPSEAKTLLEWAKEYGVRGRNDIGTDHWVGGDHIHVGPVSHIPVGAE